MRQTTQCCSIAFVGGVSSSPDITPLLLEVFSVPERYISLVFLLYGVVSIFSTLIGGKIEARNGIGTLRFLFQAAILASLYVTSHSLMAALINLSFVALVVNVMNASMQLYFIDLAAKDFPSAKD